MSAGLKLVFKLDIEEVGVCRERIFDFVERNFRRRRWGRIVGIEGKESGSFDLVKKRWVESSPPREK